MGEGGGGDAGAVEVWAGRDGALPLRHPVLRGATNKTRATATATRLTAAAAAAQDRTVLGGLWARFWMIWTVCPSIILRDSVLGLGNANHQGPPGQHLNRRLRYPSYIRSRRETLSLIHCTLQDNVNLPPAGCGYK
jgi:hypothetical protein